MNKDNDVKESQHVLVGSVKYKVQSLQNKIMKSENQLKAFKKIDDQGVDKEQNEVVGLVYEDEEV